MHRPVPPYSTAFAVLGLPLAATAGVPMPEQPMASGEPRLRVLLVNLTVH